MWSFSPGTRAAAVGSFPEGEQPPSQRSGLHLPATEALRRKNVSARPGSVHSKQMPQVPARFPLVDSLSGGGNEGFIQSWVSQKREMCVRETERARGASE